QAEDGIRDFHVTGVQTCALPILDPGNSLDLGPDLFKCRLRIFSVIEEEPPPLCAGTTLRASKGYGWVDCCCWDGSCEFCCSRSISRRMDSRRVIITLNSSTEFTCALAARTFILASRVR